MTADHPSRAAGESNAVSTEPEQSVLHGSFALARTLVAPPDRVFAAFSELALRKRWFRVPSEPGTAHHELDFRVGGHEIARGTFAPAGVPEQIEYQSQFLDIVPDERIVFTYTVLLDGRPRYMSLVTVELAADGGSTRVKRTEQYVFLVLTGNGDVDVAHLEGSMRLQFNALESVVDRSCGT